MCLDGSCRVWVARWLGWRVTRRYREKAFWQLSFDDEKQTWSGKKMYFLQYFFMFLTRNPLIHFMWCVCRDKKKSSIVSLFFVAKICYSLTSDESLSWNYVWRSFEEMLMIQNDGVYLKTLWRGMQLCKFHQISFHRCSFSLTHSLKCSGNSQFCHRDDSWRKALQWEFIRAKWFIQL